MKTYFQKFFLLTVALISSLMTMAQATKFVEFQPAINIDEGNNGAALGFQFGFLKSVADNVEVGGGLGIMEHSSFSYAPKIPLFLRTKYNLSQNETVKPFISADLGYSLNTEDFEMGGILVCPNIGISFNDFYISAGYFAYIMTKGGGVENNINLRLGYNLGKGGGIHNFFKRTKVTMEFAGGIGISDAKVKISGNNNKDATAKVKDMASLRFLWTYDINDNWEAGIGAGCNLYDTEFDYRYVASESYIQIPVFVRGQYTHFNVENKIRPYAAVDLGATIHGGANIKMNNEGFFIEPQVGVKFNNKYNAGVGLEFVNFDCEDKYSGYNYHATGGSATIIKLHLGIEF